MTQPIIQLYQYIEKTDEEKLSIFQVPGDFIPYSILLLPLSVLFCFGQVQFGIEPVMAQ
jgi:hypothetical protein